MIDKQSLLAALACTVTPVPVDGFGTINMRQVSVAENDAIRAKIGTDKDAPRSQFGLLLLVASVVNDDGTPVFSEADVQALAQSSGRKIDALVEAVLKVNGYGAEVTPGNAQG